MSFPRYPKYKASCVEWLGEVPESWGVRRIKHLGKTITGGTPKTEEPEYWTDGDVPWLPSGKVQNGSIHKEDADTFITKRALAESAAKLIKPGSALIALTGATCANAAFLTFESTANQSVVGIEPKSNSNGRFIYYSLLSQREQVLTHKSGGAQGGINQEDVRNLVITAPEKVEQTAIAEFLDRETGKIDELVAEQRRLMELLKEKRQAAISHAVTKGLNPHAPMKPSGIEWLGDVPVGWTCATLNRLSSRVVVGIAEAATHAYANEGIPILRSTNVRAGKIIGDILFIEPAFAGDRDSKRLSAGDLVTVRTGNAGVTAIVPAEFDGCQCFTMLITSLHNGESVEFYCYWMNSLAAQCYFSLEGWGTAQVNISVPILKSLPVPVPPQSEQLEIVAFLDSETAKFDTLTAEAQRAIDLLQERRTALISAAVTGQIDVRHQPRN